ncbi:MAG: polyphosphate polymerase domain-containing protein [Oscillospiraceae bacterium]|nr:polyphosphate polymerase domain-containing protein [Oscillospiraceae bacterium]
MAQTVFNRYEKKYLMDIHTWEKLMRELEPYMRQDEYGVYTICNIYYDTPDNLLIRRSIEKPAYKEKLRLRSYGVPGLDDSVFLEIKKKYNKVVNKRRISIPLLDAYRWLDEGIAPREDSQIHREIAFFLSRYDLHRGLYLAYDRTALAGIEDPDFRVTFDRNIRSRRTDMGLERGDCGQLLLPREQILMESKIMGAAPLWFSHILSGLKIFPVSFSKYGSIYKRELLTGRGDNIQITNDIERSLEIC